ncbi:putative enoyl-CoA hydratase echA8 [Variibacter gotjawalensis]|uniref:Putative enoyl-CoA hydratase echA8 n=1 Tax=Variibacter gotjawalensis TaxID=1333996 RepID=A0A0S3PSK1_9BRAD|nr:enoyl-CoA hydratase/isomerase family protein [Variibacter gotjawalensis]NIK49154.1 enoyl-CoA hydratase/carnithine racemase [Variibacter gotjawalensis]RZS51010.1 enoyl-CoA hydratase/carnithine racemase [Variibacter gotjawalensis]BAT58844.1 putative enoyl-CoA hydratase echA8 [Variibacter gotjawalensis]
MSDGEVRLVREGPVAYVTFDRPQARNAMTWKMYNEFVAICNELRNDKSVRTAVFRGAGGKAFIAGTDIAQFLEFKKPEDGLAYEKKIEGFLTGLETLGIPTIAVVEGFAVGGGMAIASVCDFRVATPGTKFGVPIARTLGNCMSTGNVARLVANVGPAVAKRMLLLGELLTAEAAERLGFVHAVVPPEEIDARVKEMTDRLVKNAPITMRVSKEALRRSTEAFVLDGEDLVRETYGSNDFREGVKAFTEKREPQWTNT